MNNLNSSDLLTYELYMNVKINITHSPKVKTYLNDLII